MRSIRTFSQAEQQLFIDAVIKVLALEERRRKEGWKKTADCSDPKILRRELGLSQKQFTLLFGFSTVGWEQGRNIMKGYHRLLLNLIYRSPSEVVAAAIAEREHPSDIPLLIKGLRHR